MNVESAALALYSATVRPEWVDYNGHMHEAYYVLVFGNASDALYDHIGMDAAYRERTATSVYTMEAHINYLHEVGEAAPLAVATRIVDLDEKRLHIFHALHHGTDGRLLATEELLLLNVDARGPRAAPFPAAIVNRLQALKSAHRALPRPPQLGRRIGIARRRANHRIF